MKKLKLIYAGTPEFAVPPLQALINAGYSIQAVYTQPDRPSGRGQKISQSPVKNLAEQYGIPIEQPLHFKEPQERDILRSYHPDLIIVAAYGIIFTQELLDIPPMGCINLHPSLLPHYRGALPIQQALLDGISTTGMTLMKMEQGLDSGPILSQKKLEISPTDNAQTLSKRLALSGAEMLCDVLNDWDSIEKNAVPQDHSKATYTKKLTKQMALIDWHKPASLLAREVQAFIPWPISYCLLDGQPIRIWQAQLLNENDYKLENPSAKSIPGTILNINSHGIDVATTHGVLRLECLQLPGKKAMPVASLLNGHSQWFVVGKRFD
jgi:methionyl-tRNA formyltransferase